MRTDFVYIVGFYFLFLIQYLVAAGLFCFRFPKRKLFWLRLPAALLLCGGLALLWSEGAQEYVILLIARYLLLFCGAFAAVLLCFRVSMPAALFCVTGGYALQHFAQVCASSAFGALADAGAADVWLVAAYTAAFIVIYLAGYFIFAARMQRSETVIAGEKGIVLLSAGVLFCVVVLSSVFDASDAQIPADIAFVCGGFEAMCCLLGLGMLFFLFRRRQTEYEMHAMLVLWEQEKQQYKLTKDRVDLINIKCHDIKKYISQLRGGGKVSDAEVNELESLVSLYDRAVHTGNEVIDVLLADKSLSCEKEGIRLSCMVDGKLFSFLSSSDTYSLFGNILDNAVTAAAHVPEPERRVVSLTSAVSAGMLFLHGENYFAGEVRLEEGFPKTSSGDEAHHGFGTRSIAYIARKYGGEARFAARGGIFCVDVVFPLSKSS